MYTQKESTNSSQCLLLKHVAPLCEMTSPQHTKSLKSLRSDLEIEVLKGRVALTQQLRALFH